MSFLKCWGLVLLTVDQLRDILQSLSEAGHGNLPVHALAEGLTGPVRSADVVPGWNPAVGTVTLLRVIMTVGV
ncbi:hypothetical protein QO239_09640 [Cupriavidus taiwanensis]|uniref:hypothetical protein n=1 Tax=Cupriavidus taiwanensis TaxID=164546 RepID=UPI00253FF316|nr:hypothetical protein [Cupriavidus taiwanensis]MDK3022852.1 hypothetical protein [Cupriavidus taiwanensis]